MDHTWQDSGLHGRQERFTVTGKLELGEQRLREVHQDLRHLELTDTAAGELLRPFPPPAAAHGFPRLTMIRKRAQERRESEIGGNSVTDGPQRKPSILTRRLPCPMRSPAMT
jgi:hypothetical protein